MTSFTHMIKQKGTGESMGKSLFKPDLEFVEPLFLDSTIPLASKATLLTALLMLKPNPDEMEWLEKIRLSPSSYFPDELLFMFSPSSDPFEVLIQKILLHENLTYIEMKEGMSYLFSDTIPDPQKAAFLEGERLKRETVDENNASLDFLYSQSQHVTTSEDMILDISKPYDGFNRFPNLSLFLAPILASLGLKVVLHGSYDMSPKYGITPHKLLKEKNLNPLHSMDVALHQLHTCGWTYIDQEIFTPKLHQLKPLRSDIIKRPLLATIEKFLSPIQAKHGNIILTGYTHPPYKGMTQNILSHAPHVAGYIITRGMEGSTQLPPDRRAPFLFSINDVITDDFVSPEEFDLTLLPRLAAFSSLTAAETATMGLNALQNQTGLAYSILSYNAAFLYSKLTEIPYKTALKNVERVIASGDAFKFWTNQH